MAKVCFLNQTVPFMSESYNSQLQKMKLLYLGSDEKENSGKYLNKIEARFGKEKWKMNNLKIKL